jgi:hypothetical protein
MVVIEVPNERGQLSHSDIKELPFFPMQGTEIAVDRLPIPLLEYFHTYCTGTRE